MSPERSDRLSRLPDQSSSERSTLAVSKGDEVIYGRYAGNDIQVDRKELKILRESDILAKIQK